MITPSLVGALANRSVDVTALEQSDLVALRRHGLTPALWALVDDQLPANSATHELVRRWVSRDLMRTMRLVAAATSVNARLAAADVPSLVIKGAPLAVRSAGSWTHRSFSDVDVLIASADRPRAHEALLSSGFSRRNGSATAPGRVSDYSRGAAEYQDASVTIDLHWRLDSVKAYYNCRFEDLWDRRVRVTSRGLDVWTVDETDSLLITAVHGCREMWHRWKWALDAFRQVSHQPADSWADVRSRARDVGAEKALAVTVAVANECGLPTIREAAPGLWAQGAAHEWLEAGHSGLPLEFTLRTSIDRRIARFSTADTRRAGMNGAVRSVVRQGLDAGSGKLQSRWRYQKLRPADQA